MCGIKGSASSGMEQRVFRHAADLFAESYRPEICRDNFDLGKALDGIAKRTNYSEPAESAFKPEAGEGRPNVHLRTVLLLIGTAMICDCGLLPVHAPSTIEPAKPSGHQTAHGGVGLTSRPRSGKRPLALTGFSLESRLALPSRFF